MEKIDAKLQRMDSRLKALNAKLDKLVAQSKEASVEGKIDIRKRIDAIKAKRAEAEAKLSEFRTTTEHKWDHFKYGVGVAWKDLEGAFKELVK